ncbi:MAG: hypothetical protein AAFZ65_19815, partial [Planctomycetota bacterium]
MRWSLHALLVASLVAGAVRFTPVQAGPTRQAPATRDATRRAWRDQRIGVNRTAHDLRALHATDGALRY